MYFLTILVIEVASLIMLAVFSYYNKTYFDKQSSWAELFFLSHGVVMIFFEIIFFGYQIGLWWGLPQ